MKKIKEESPTVSIGAGNVDFNPTGRNKYDSNRMCKRNAGIETITKWLKKIQDEVRKRKEQESQ